MNCPACAAEIDAQRSKPRLATLTVMLSPTNVLNTVRGAFMKLIVSAFATS